MPLVDPKIKKIKKTRKKKLKLGDIHVTNVNAEKG